MRGSRSWREGGSRRRCEATGGTRAQTGQESEGKGQSAAKGMGKGTGKANASRSETELREEAEHVEKGHAKAFIQTPHPIA